MIVMFPDEYLLGEKSPEAFVLRTSTELIHERLLADIEKRKANDKA